MMGQEVFNEAIAPAATNPTRRRTSKSRERHLRYPTPPSRGEVGRGSRWPAALPRAGPQGASSTQGSFQVKANALRTIRKLSMKDILQLANDPLLYRVVALEQLLGGRWKVVLRSMDAAASVVLVRSGTDQVFVVPGGALMH